MSSRSTSRRDEKSGRRRDDIADIVWIHFSVALELSPASRAICLSLASE